MKIIQASFSKLPKSPGSFWFEPAPAMGWRIDGNGSQNTAMKIMQRSLILQSGNLWAHARLHPSSLFLGWWLFLLNMHFYISERFWASACCRMGSGRSEAKGVSPINIIKPLDLGKVVFDVSCPQSAWKSAKHVTRNACSHQLSQQPHKETGKTLLSLYPLSATLIWYLEHQISTFSRLFMHMWNFSTLNRCQSRHHTGSGHLGTTTSIPFTAL